ncbi:unnamed protein product [Rotaria socialis]|uniref:Serine aminopeptidase S33 domain-containing protein n=1 Tax=Rotaria socialis TaxID=392032 RepID=A0A818DHS4_9BILA|nr:unnamed protein product [Rotaria socialis]CAF3447573.1 unnamed protein product [Rotaria socialis]CAF3475856.1 unnamed protein product [Rotaria socialis]CAF3504420.1 unnamed protein product [Rotaria socialis]CAF4469980.1 unnamed protein product [Rotaria socialis]
MKAFELLSHDGLRISAFDWPSYEHPDSPTAVIILIHGVAEYSGRYEHVAHFFNGNNMAMVSMDLRGHGLSEGKHVFISTSEIIFQDMDLLINEVRSRYSSCPAILYGHSMGGNLVLSYTLNRYPNASDKCPYQALVVSSPWIRLAGYLQPPRAVDALIRKMGQLSPTLKFPLRFDPSMISRDETTILAYNEDPHIRRSTTLSLAHSVGSMAKMLDRSSCTFHMPVLLQHGSADAITSHNASLKFANRGKNIQFKSWNNCYHELHNEPEKDYIFGFTLRWIYDKILD